MLLPSGKIPDYSLNKDDLMKQTDLSLSQRRDYFGIFFPF